MLLECYHCYAVFTPPDTPHLHRYCAACFGLTISDAGDLNFTASIRVATRSMMIDPSQPKERRDAIDVLLTHLHQIENKIGPQNA